MCGVEGTRFPSNGSCEPQSRTVPEVLVNSSEIVLQVIKYHFKNVTIHINVERQRKTRKHLPTLNVRLKMGNGF